MENPDDTESRGKGQPYLDKCVDMYRSWYDRTSLDDSVSSSRDVVPLVSDRTSLSPDVFRLHLYVQVQIAIL